MSADAERSKVTAETSPGRALALLALAPIATSEADQREREETEERERQEADERARRRQVELEEALAEAPELGRPNRPNEPPAGEFDSERCAMTLWLIPVFLIFVGNWVSDKTIFDSGYPWFAMLALPVLLAILNGFWPVIRTMPARERHQARMQEYEAEIREADYREAERAAIRAEFEDEDEESVPCPEGGEQPGGAESLASVRFDGCYVADGPDYHYFARFFPGGEVMTVTLSGTGDEAAEASALSLMDWLVPSDESDDAVSRGSFSQHGSEVSFAATSESGTVNYEGTVHASAKELHLHSHSLINGHQSDEVWRFIPV